jgi:hypothetical protein
MRVNLRRRIALAIGLLVPAVAVLALSASPALAALPRYGRLVLGAHNTVSPLAVLIIALGAAAGVSLIAISARRRSRSHEVATVSTLVAPGESTRDDSQSRKAA